jgi:hypothetical protein
MLLYTIPHGLVTVISWTVIICVAVHFIANALSKKMEQQQKEQARKAILAEHVRGAEWYGTRGYENYLVATAQGLTGDDRKIYANEVCNGDIKEDLSPIQDYLHSLAHSYHPTPKTLI